MEGGIQELKKEKRTPNVRAAPSMLVLDFCAYGGKDRQSQMVVDKVEKGSEGFFSVPEGRSRPNPCWSPSVNTHCRTMVFFVDNEEGEVARKECGRQV